MTTLDEQADQILKEENATAEAVKSLIQIDDNKPHDVELKTDLTERQIITHSVLSILGDTIQAGSSKFEDIDILNEMVTKIERKSWSKNRRSRTEIVEIARQPEQRLDMGGDQRRQGFLSRLFAPRRKENQDGG